MFLSKNDQIEVGLGCLYGPPFLSRFLIYRIFGSKRTILLRHKEAIVDSTVSTFGNVTEVSARFVHPTIIYVHCCFDSAFAGLDDLLRLPAVEMPVPKSAATIAQLEDVTVRLERLDVGYTEKIIVARETENQRTMRLEKSDFQVTGPIKITLWPSKAQIKDSKRRYIKVSVGISGSDIGYDLDSAGDWSLTALGMEDAGLTPLEVNLERINQQNT
jgi:hypothetical protein